LKMMAGTVRKGPVMLEGTADAPAPHRRVKGPALIWKDLRYFFPSSRWEKILAFALGGFALTVLYLPSMLGNGKVMNEPVIQDCYIMFYLGLTAVLTLLMSATSITMEKESRALVLLLTTPMGDWHIILTKAWGVLQRAMATLIMLAIHLIVFTAMGYISVVSSLLVACVTIYMLVFLGGLGMYCSSRCRTSTAAIIGAVGVCVVLWAVVPLSMRFTSMNSQEAAGITRLYNPFSQLVKAVEGGPNSKHSGNFSAGGRSDGEDLVVEGWWTLDRVTCVLLSLVVYGSVGLLLAWRGKTIMRKKLFE